MKEEDKHFIKRYEELLDKGYCDCNEMNCIDNNSPRRILNIVKDLQTRWNSLREWLENEKLQMEGYFDTVLDKMNELEGVNKDERKDN